MKTIISSQPNFYYGLFILGDNIKYNHAFNSLFIIMGVQRSMVKRQQYFHQVNVETITIRNMVGSVAIVT